MNNPLEMTEQEQIAQHYKALGDSVWLINAVIAGTEMANDTQEEKTDCVKRNVEHLEIMKAKDFWTDEDFTDVDAAVVSGNNYLLAE
jgi:hypothetical protein